MTINGPGEITAKPSRARPDGGFPALLRAVALIAVVAGAGGSVGLILWAGHRNPSRVLLGLFVIWDLSPFMGLLLADMVSKRWSVITRATLHIVMLVLALSSLALYGDVLKDHILTHHAGQTVLVVGHSNTVPELIKLLGGPSLPIIDDCEFDNLFVLVKHSTAKASVSKLKYGDPTSAPC